MEKEIIMTAKQSSIELGVRTLTVFLVMLSACLFSCTPDENLPERDASDVGSEGPGSLGVAPPAGEDEASDPDTDLHQCPLPGDELYLVVNHGVAIEYSVAVFMHELYTPEPLHLSAAYSLEKDAGPDDIAIDGECEDCGMHVCMGNAGDCSAYGEGSMGIKVEGYCKDAVVHLHIQETWSDFEVDVCGARIPYPAEDFDQGEKAFPLSEAWTSVGAVVEVPFVVGEGVHSWTLFTDLELAKNLSEEIIDTFPKSGIPNVPLDR
jgi:hypothetical protein